ncbi:hypothetical protein [Curtobacterium sp. Curtsp57]
MAESDYAYYDRERRQWGYWSEDWIGQVHWVPIDGNPAHRAESD